MMIIIYLNFSIMLFLFSMMLMFFMMKFLLIKMKLFIELNLMKINSMNYSILFYFDYKSLMFMMVVLMISSMIIIYSIEYMKMEKFYMRFIYLLVLFVISMLLMIIGQNLLMILLGWDGLGLISYCLVIYYNNWSSYNAGLLTILTNRLGDIGLLISIGMFSIYGDWNYMMLNIKNLNVILMFMLMLGVMTKSAQMPFSSWLPKAMAAPTPISALVHSSTLVTAGVYLLMRLMMMINFYSFYMMFLSLLTMFFSGLIASFENDLKKIIALSTLSQLGLMMFSLMLDLKMLSFFHLIIHAMFKSLLFMCAGLILHSMFNSQDIRFLGVMNNNYLLTLMMFNISNLSLCGFPFLSGFYSKDLILEFSNLMNLNYLVLIMFYLSIIFTINYSFRLIYYMIVNYMKFFSLSLQTDNKLMNYSMMLMFMFSMMGGVLFSWLVYTNINLIFLSSTFKIMFIIMFLMYMIMVNFFFFKNFKMKKMLFNFMNSMWMMNYFVNYINKNMLMYSNLIFNNLDKGWVEMMGYKFIYYYYKNFMMMEKLTLNLLIKMIMLFFIFMIMII